MIATPLLGQGPEYDRYLRAACAGALPHGLLLEGGEGTGKTHAAFEFARAIVCGSASVDGPCRSCGPCLKVTCRNHADLHVLAPPPDKQDIPVELVRDLQARLGRSAIEGGARIVVIDPADRLNEQGQNALLKTLEEPGRDTYLLLLTRRPEGLLETVRSRVARVRLMPLSDDLVAQTLTADGVDADLAALAASGASGSIGVARVIASDETRALDLRLAEFCAAPWDLPLAAVREILQGTSGRTEVDAHARLALRLLRSRVRGQLQTSLADGDRGQYVESLAERWTTVLEALFRAEDDLALGIGAVVVLDRLFLRLAEALSGRPSLTQANPIDP